MCVHDADQGRTAVGASAHGNIAVVGMACCRGKQGGAGAHCTSLQLPISFILVPNIAMHFEAAESTAWTGRGLDGHRAIALTQYLNFHRGRRGRRTWKF